MDPSRSSGRSYGPPLADYHHPPYPVPHLNNSVYDHTAHVVLSQMPAHPNGGPPPYSNLTHSIAKGPLENSVKLLFDPKERDYYLKTREKYNLPEHIPGFCRKYLNIRDPLEHDEYTENSRNGYKNREPSHDYRSHYQAYNNYSNNIVPPEYSTRVDPPHPGYNSSHTSYRNHSDYPPYPVNNPLHQTTHQSFRYSGSNNDTTYISNPETENSKQAPIIPSTRHGYFNEDSIDGRFNSHQNKRSSNPPTVHQGPNKHFKTIPLQRPEEIITFNYRSHADNHYAYLSSQNSINNSRSIRSDARVENQPLFHSHMSASKSPTLNQRVSGNAAPEPVLTNSYDYAPPRPSGSSLPSQQSEIRNPPVIAEEPRYSPYGSFQAHPNPASSTKLASSAKSTPAVNQEKGNEFVTESGHVRETLVSLSPNIDSAEVKDKKRPRKYTKRSKEPTLPLIEAQFTTGDKQDSPPSKLKDKKVRNTNTKESRLKKEKPKENPVTSRIEVDLKRQSKLIEHYQKMGVSEDLFMKRDGHVIDWSRLGISDELWETCYSQLEHVMSNRTIKLPTRKALIVLSALIALQCRRHEIPRTFSEIASLAEIKKGEVGGCYKALALMPEFGAPVTSQIDGAELCIRWGNALQLPKAISQLSALVYKKADILGITATRSHTSICSGCLWFVVSIANTQMPHYNSSRPDQRDFEPIRCTVHEIAVMAGVVPFTIQAVSRILITNRDDLVTPEALECTLDDFVQERLLAMERGSEAEEDGNSSDVPLAAASCGQVIPSQSENVNPSSSNADPSIDEQTGQEELDKVFTSPTSAESASMDARFEPSGSTSPE